MTSDALDNQEQLALIDEAVASLRKMDRELILMRYFQSRDVGSIAVVLNISEQAARKRIARAIERIRLFLDLRGGSVTTSVASAVLVNVSHHSAPTQFVDAPHSSSASPYAQSLSRAASKYMFIQKMSIAGLIAVVLCVIALSAGLLLRQSQRSTVHSSHALAVTVPLPAITAEQAKTELERTYALAPGQIIKVIPAPFSTARTVWADKEIPYARGANNIRSLGFLWNSGNDKPADRLHWHYMSYIDQSLSQIINLALETNWQQVEGFDAVNWKNMHADFVVRDDATVDQKLTALTELINRETNQSLTLRSRKVTRPAIVLTQPTTRRGFQNKDHFNVVYLTEKPLTDVLLARFETGWTPKGSTHSFDIRSCAKELGAPYVGAENMGSEGNLYGIGLFVIAADARLKPSDSDYLIKLGHVLKNLQMQTGGEWQIKPKEFEVYSLEPVGL